MSSRLCHSTRIAASDSPHPLELGSVRVRHFGLLVGAETANADFCTRNDSCTLVIRDDRLLLEECSVAELAHLCWAAHLRPLTVAVVFFLGSPMHICYMDESGCTGILPNHQSTICFLICSTRVSRRCDVTPIQPVLVLAAVIVDESRLHKLTIDYLNLKQRFFPGKLPVTAEFLQWILAEVKGSEIRKLRSAAQATEAAVMRTLSWMSF